MLDLNKEYHDNNTSPDEEQLIRDRIYWKNGTLYYLELPHLTDHSMKITTSKFLEEVEDYAGLVNAYVDISESSVPTYRQLIYVQNEYRDKVHKFKRLSVFIGDNKVISVAVKFMVKAIGFDQVKIFTNKEEALLDLNK